MQKVVMKMAKRSYTRTKSPKYTAVERRAYWIGVGISAERHGDSRKLLDSSNVAIRNSVRSGYEADNRRDLSSKIGGK